MLGLKTNGIYKGLKQSAPSKYYKYVYEPFVQPTLTNDGTEGIDDLAVFLGTAHGNHGVGGRGGVYVAFSPNTGSVGYTVYKAAVGVDIGMYFKYPINPTKLTVGVTGYGGSNNTVLYGGNYPIFAFGEPCELIQNMGYFPVNAISTVDITCDKYYHWLFFYGYTPGGLGGDHLYYSSIKIEGTIKKLVESNSSDYDICVPQNTYKLFRAYEKGQVCKEMFNS